MNLLFISASIKVIEKVYYPAAVPVKLHQGLQLRKQVNQDSPEEGDGDWLNVAEFSNNPGCTGPNAGIFCRTCNKMILFVKIRKNRKGDLAWGIIKSWTVTTLIFCGR
jgi:hypothetical protein